MPPTELNLTGHHQFNPKVLTQKMRSQNTPTTAWTLSPNSCSHRCSKLRLRKTFAGYYPTRISQGSRWRKHTKFSSRITGWKWTKSSPRCMWSQTNSKIRPIKSRTLLLSNLNNDSNPGNRTTIGAAATIDHEDRITETRATIARTSTRIQTSPGATSPEIVNTVFTAK